jgi:multiple sugar transport system substrate-binding protein
MSKSKALTRRKFLRLAGLGSAGAAMAACAAPQVAPQVIKETVVVETEKLVQKVETVVVEKAIEVEKVVVETVVVEQAAPITINGTLWIIQKKDFFPSFNDWWRAQVLDFCKEKGWPVDVTYEAGFTSGTPWIEKLTAQAAAGNPPDMVMHTDSAVQMFNNNLVDPVQDMVDEIEAKWGKAAPRQYSDFVFDGQWRFVPYFQRSDGGWYQAPVFEGAGIKLDEVRLYPDLWDACLQVSAPDKEIYGWGVTINRSGDGDWFRHRVTHGWGAYKMDETGNYVTFDSPEMVDAMTAMTGIYMDEKYAPMLPPGVLSWGDSANNEAYLAGKLAYTQNGGTVYAKALLDGNPIRDVTKFHAPVGGPVNTEFNGLSANYMALMKGAKNQNAAREIIKEFILPLENYDAMLANNPSFGLPAYEKLWDEAPYIQSDPVAQEQKKVARDPAGAVVPGAYPGPPQSKAYAAAIQAGVEADMVASILQGTPVAEAVKTCHDRYVQIWKDNGLPGEKA